jgi:hypothetical protein
MIVQALHPHSNAKLAVMQNSYSKAEETSRRLLASAHPSTAALAGQLPSLSGLHRPACGQKRPNSAMEAFMYSSAASLCFYDLAVWQDSGLLVPLLCNNSFATVPRNF